MAVASELTKKRNRLRSKSKYVKHPYPSMHDLNLIPPSLQVKMAKPLYLTLLILSFVSSTFEIKRTKDLNLVLEGPILNLHQPGSAGTMGVLVTIAEDLLEGVTKEAELTKTGLDTLERDLRKYGIQEEKEAFKECVQRISEAKAAMAVIPALTERLLKYRDEGVQVGLELPKESTAKYEVTTELYLSQTHRQVVLVQGLRQAPEATTKATSSQPGEGETSAEPSDNNQKGFDMLCGMLGGVVSHAERAKEHAEESLALVNMLANNMVPSLLMSALDIKVPASAGRLENTLVKSCMKTVQGFKCLLESTSNKDSEKVNEITSLPFLVNDEVIEIDWYPMTKPVAKANTAIMTDVTGCQTLGVTINCRGNLRFSVNSCLEAIHERNFAKILKICELKRSEGNAEPFVQSHKGITTIAQRSEKALTLKLSSTGIYDDPVRVHHADVLHLTYIDNETEIVGDDSVTEQKIEKLWLNSTQREELAAKSHRLSHMIDQIIPGDMRDYMTLSSLIISTLGLVSATICSYKITKWLQTNKQDEQGPRESRIRWYVPLEALQRYRTCSRIRRKIAQGDSLTETEYLMAIKAGCKEGESVNQKMHWCQNIPLSAVPRSLRDNVRTGESSMSALLQGTQASAPIPGTSTSVNAPSENVTKTSSRLADLKSPVVDVDDESPEKVKTVFSPRPKQSSPKGKTPYRAGIAESLKPKAGYKRPNYIDTRVYKYLEPHESTILKLMRRITWLDNTFDLIVKSIHECAVVESVQSLDEEFMEELEAKARERAEGGEVKSRISKGYLNDFDLPVVFNINLVGEDAKMKPETEIDQLLMKLVSKLEQIGRPCVKKDVTESGMSLSEIFNGMRGYKKVEPVKMTVYLQASKVETPKMFPRSTIKHVNKSGLRSMMPYQNAMRIKENQIFLAQGNGFYRQFVEYEAPFFMLGQICEYCMDFCSNPIDFNMYSYGTLMSFRMRCKPWTSQYGQLPKKDYYSQTKYLTRTCDRCRSSKCLQPFNAEDFSPHEKHFLVFKCQSVKQTEKDRTLGPQSAPKQGIRLRGKALDTKNRQRTR
jgi:hypothetical protein